MGISCSNNNKIKKKKIYRNHIENKEINKDKINNEMLVKDPLEINIIYNINNVENNYINIFGSKFVKII